MTTPVCPYCGSTTPHLDGCERQSSAIARAVREVFTTMEDERSAKFRALAQSATSTKLVRLASDQAQLLCGRNENRGIVMVINADINQVFFATDENLMNDATKQVPLLGRNTLIFTSPAELWGLGSQVGAQNVYVLELPPGRQDAEYAQLIGSGAPAATNVSGDAGVAQTQAYAADGQSGALLGLVVDARQFGWNGVAADRIRTLISSRTVSAVHVLQAVVIELGNLHDTLAIQSIASAATANLTVEASMDNVNWILIDTIAAALAIVKQYTAATVGAGIALSPLSFRYVRITAGDAGVGNTTTLTIAAK